MSLIERIKEKAKSSVKTIVLPEGDEARTIQAAAIVQREGIAKPILLGNEQMIPICPKTIVSFQGRTGSDGRACL